MKSGSNTQSKTPVDDVASGMHWACDQKLRDTVIDFAGDTRHANSWPAGLYQRAAAQGHELPVGARILARACLYVIWHGWNDGAA